MSDITRREGGKTTAIVPVAEGQLWEHRRIREWRAPDNVAVDLPVRYCPYFYLPLAGRSLSAAFLRRSLKAYDGELVSADLVFAAWLYPDGVAAVNWAAGRGKRAAVLVQGSDTAHLEAPLRRLQILDALKKDVQIFCVWKGLADKLARAGVPSTKITVVPNGVDEAMFHYRPRKEARETIVERGKWKVGSGDLAKSSPYTFHLSPSTPLFLFVGNLVPVKGPDRAIRAFARVVEEYKVKGERYKAENGALHFTPSTFHSLLLLIIGEGPMRRQLQRLAYGLGIADNVLFLGSKPQDELALWMNAADCLVLASRSEGMPNVVIEALASGLPVVATDAGAVPEMLAGQSDCVVVESEKRKAEIGLLTGDGKKESEKRTVEELAAGMVSVLARPTDRQALAQRNKDRFSWRRMAATILDVMGNRVQGSGFRQEQGGDHRPILPEPLLPL